MFACRIRGNRDSATERKQRSDVDDLAFAAREHLTADGLREKEHGIEIGIDYRVPVFCRIIRGRMSSNSSGVVDQDIDVAGCFEYLFSETQHGGSFAQVGCKLPRPA